MELATVKVISLGPGLACGLKLISLDRLNGWCQCQKLQCTYIDLIKSVVYLY